MFTFDEQKILKRFQDFRKKRGLTQKQVDEKLSLRPNTLFDLEKGRLKMSLEMATQLLNLYEQNFENLFCFEKEPEENSVDFLKTYIPLLQTGVVGDDLSPLVLKMYEDPIIVSEVGLGRLGTQESLMSFLLENLTTAQKRNFIIEMYRYINSLIAVDHRITREELTLRDTLLKYTRIEFTETEMNSVRRALGKEYLGGGIQKSFPRDAYKHFLIWVLYLVAMTDKEMNHEEKKYIERVAKNIELKRSAFDYITNAVVGPATRSF